MARQWEDVAPRFRERFNPSQGSMGTWDDAELAYRYGWEAAGWPQYTGHPWPAAALDLERGWQEYQRTRGRRIPTEWEGYRKAVEEGYEAASADVTATPAPLVVSPGQVVREFLDAYNSKGKASLDTIMNSLAPDAEIIFSPVAGSVRGERNLRAAFTGLFADEAGTQIIVNNVLEGPEMAAAEWIERGRNYRTAEDVLRYVAGFFEVRGGKIQQARLYTVRVR